MPEQDDGDPVGEAAASWFLRLRALGAGAEEYERFAAWLATDPAHRAAYTEVEEAWERLGTLAPHGSGAGAGVARSLGRRRLLRRVPALASAGFGVAGAAWLLGRAQETGAGAFRTRSGQRAEAALPDGTRLALDAASAAERADTGGFRRVVLTSGQLVAEVAADPGGRPFELAVAGLGGLRLSAAAAGTLAAKRSGEANGRVAVLAASASAEGWAVDGEMPVPLAAGMELRLGSAGARPRPSDPEAVAGWRQGRLAYRDAPLAEVAEDLARHRGGWVVLADDGLRRLRVTAALAADDPDGALAALAAALPIRVLRLPGLAVVRPA